jgi:predicted NAD/FAD-binding protein
MELDRGFLIYVPQTYPAMVPFFKVIHLTLDGWRGGRDEQGWKRALSEMEALRRNGDPEGLLVCDSEKAPSMVEPVLRFEADDKALSALASSDDPPNRAMLPNAVL